MDTMTKKAQTPTNGSPNGFPSGREGPLRGLHRAIEMFKDKAPKGTLAQIQVFLVIASHDEFSLTNADIVRVEGVNQTSVTEILNRLGPGGMLKNGIPIEGLKLIEVRPDSQDHRRAPVRLSRAGRILADNMVTAIRAGRLHADGP